MKLAISIAVVALTAIGAQAASTVVTFDSLVGQGTVPQGYGGINWNGNWDYYDWSQPPYNAATPPTRIYTDYGLPFSDGSGENSFEFPTPTVFDGAYFAGQSNVYVQLNLYLANVLVATSATLTPTSVPTFLASGYGGLVDRVGVYSDQHDQWVMDNVTYGGAVPEPGTIGLFSAGLIALALGRRLARR